MTGLETALPKALRPQATGARAVRVTDVRPLPPTDLRGISPFHLALGPLAGHDAALALAGLLICFAVGNVAVGLQPAFGVAGTGLAILLLVVLGTPSSGGPFSTGLLPERWRAIGPFLPPRSGVDLVRNISHFDGHATPGPVLVLLAWLAAGLALVVVFARHPPRGLPTHTDGAPKRRPR